MGNYLSSDGQRVAVEDVTFNEDGTSSMDLSLTPEDSTPAAPATRKGYTYEEEMFRLKWGVSAYQHAKSLARSAANGN